MLPLLLSRENFDIKIIHQIIEIYEICLELLQDSNHTIVNASLECVCIISENPKPALRKYLTSFRHVDILRKKKTLKNVIFNRKSSASSIEIMRSMTDSRVLGSLMSSSSTPKKVGHGTGRWRGNFNLNNDCEVDSMRDEIEGGLGIRSKGKTSATDGLLKKTLDESTSSTASTLTANDDRALLTCSDIEMDSFRSVDSELYDTCYDSASMQSPARNWSHEKPAAETVSLKSQKSTESIGSIINSILSHPNTGK